MANTGTCYPSGAAVEHWGSFNRILREDLGSIAFPYSSSWSIHQGFGREEDPASSLGSGQLCLLTQKPNSQAGPGFGCPLRDCADTAPPSLGNKYFLHCLMDFPTVSWTDPMNTAVNSGRASAEDGMRIFAERLSPGRNHALFSLHLGKLISTFFLKSLKVCNCNML